MNEYVNTEIINGVIYAVDRRVVETQPDGKRIIRDQVTGKAWMTDGTQLPDGWRWNDDHYQDDYFK